MVDKVVVRKGTAYPLWHYQIVLQDNGSERVVYEAGVRKGEGGLGEGFEEVNRSTERVDDPSEKIEDQRFEKEPLTYGSIKEASDVCGHELAFFARELSDDLSAKLELGDLEGLAEGV